MEADLFPWRGRGSNEFFDGSKNVRELTRDFPITRSSHHTTNAVHPAASPHVVLLVVLLLKGFDFTSEIAIRIHKSAELHERAHDCDVDRYSTSTTENARQHSDALLGECDRQRIGSAILLGCGHNL